MRTFVVAVNFPWENGKRYTDKRLLQLRISPAQYQLLGPRILKRKNQRVNKLAITLAASGRTAGKGAQQHQQEQQPGGQTILQAQRQGHGDDGAHGELALSTDIKEIGVVGKGKGQGGEDKRGGLYQNLAQVILIGDDFPQGLAAHVQGIHLHEQQQKAADDQADDHGGDIIQKNITFRPHAVCTSSSSGTPAISRPICWVVS